MTIRWLVLAKSGPVNGAILIRTAPRMAMITPIVAGVAARLRAANSGMNVRTVNMVNPRMHPPITKVLFVPVRISLSMTQP